MGSFTNPLLPKKKLLKQLNAILLISFLSFSFVFISVCSKSIVVLDEQSRIFVEQHFVLLRHSYQPHCCFLLPVQLCSSGCVSGTKPVSSVGRHF